MLGSKYLQTTSVECVSAFLPRCANSSDFEEETVINIGRELGFYELENEDVLELLSSHSEELTDDLLLLTEQRTFEEVDNDTEERDMCK
jgi:hypothetical protein